MPKALHILTTCTKRKTAPIPPRLMLRDVPPGETLERADEWLRRVRSPRCPRVEARQLYCGDHWSVARSLVALAARRGFAPQLWVISTGYGLIPAEAEIAPYSATFSPTHPDSVGSGAEAFARWWVRVAQWEGPSPGSPRTIAELFGSDPRSAVLLVSSEAYLGAVRADLEAAAGELADPDTLVVVSAGTKRLGALDGNLLPVDARLQAVLGGARRALNVRMARRVLEECGPEQFGAATLARRYRRLLEAQPELEVVRREKSTDADVVAFVSAALAREPGVTATRLLDRYRQSGRACEQKRFKRIYQELVAQSGQALRARSA